MSYSQLGLSQNRRQRSAATQRDATLAQNAYSRFLSQQRGERSLRDLTERTDKDLGALSAAYSQRGLRNSGIQQRGRNEFTTQTERERMDLNQAMEDQAQLLGLSDANALRAYNDIVEEDQLDKASEIAQAAQILLDFYPFLGS
jgi:hypothetical protein